LGVFREDAVWAIGGKWEQQFMGREDGQETLLPGAWLNAHQEWDFVGWDGWQQPEPRTRCHGCHTVGLDAESGEFVEPNIGCEACHGPGSWHESTYGFGRVASGHDAQICGQCHTRGRSPTGEFFFPAGYRPGGDLEAYFVFSEASNGQNASDWWGNGRARHRHQEFNVWREGGHADSLRKLQEGYDGRFGPVTGDCMRCHAAEGVFASSRSLDDKLALHGITCSVCHNVHGALDELRIGCNSCHIEGAFYHEPERNADHVACPKDANVGCVGCHMPVSVSIGGAFQLHDHGPGVVPPGDTEAWGTPNSCANGGCHTDVAAETLHTWFDRHYGEHDRRQ